MPSEFWWWYLALLLWIKLLNYIASCLKQSVKVSTELVNILQKYLKSKNTFQAALKQLKPSIASSESVSTLFHEWDSTYISFLRSVSI